MTANYEMSAEMDGTHMEEHIEEYKKVHWTEILKARGSE